MEGGVKKMSIYSIKMRHHWWIDAGIAGLYLIAGSNDDIFNKYNIRIKVNPKENSLDFEYDDRDNLRDFFTECYEILANKYWNVSTKKQKENPELVVYDIETGVLSLVPKRTPTPVAGLFVGARSWRGEGIAYEDMDAELKQKVHKYLTEKNKSLWSKKKLLLYNPPVCHQKLDILPEIKQKKLMDTCCVCGAVSSSCSDIGLPSYLLFASGSASRSFNSQAKGPAKICWECEFLSKFALESVSYKQSKEDLFIIQVYSSQIEKLINLQNQMGTSSAMRQVSDDFFYANIGMEKDSILQYAGKPYEILWAFFNDKYSLLKKENVISGEGFVNDSNVCDDEVYMAFLEEIHTFPVQIFMLFTSESGDTFLTRELIIYQDIGYVFRLINYLWENDVDLRLMFQSLWDSDSQKNQNLVRERICRGILKKESVLHILEPFCFKKVINGRSMPMKNMLQFAVNYEIQIKEDVMKKEQIETAVNLGKQIVIQALQQESEDKMKENILKKIKGDLFVLRKSRTKADFLTELNNLQFRYGITVSSKLLDGILEEVDFEDFRAYCIMGALNVFNSNSRKEEERS